MGLLLYVILGFAAGYLASVVMKTNSSQGPFMDIIMGVIGAVVGGFAMGFFGQPGVTGLNLYSLFVATLGAILVIGIGRALASRS